MTAAPFLFLCMTRLFFNGCAYRTCSGTRTARNTLICVNNIFAVAFGYAGTGTSLCASTAGNAFVSNFISHFIHLRNSCLLSYCIIKKSFVNTKFEFYFFSIISSASSLFAACFFDFGQDKTFTSSR